MNDLFQSCTALSARAVGIYGGSARSQLDAFNPNVMTQNVSPQNILQALKVHPAKVNISFFQGLPLLKNITLSRFFLFRQCFWRWL